MAPINFGILLADYPEYANEWKALKGWFDRNPGVQYVELSVLLRALPAADQYRLVLAIQTMVERGMLELSYRVKAPGGYLLEGEFSEPDEIPARLPDRDFRRYIQTAESDIVSWYRWASADAS